MVLLFPFPTMFSTHPKANFNFRYTFKLSASNALHLDRLKNFVVWERVNEHEENLFEGIFGKGGKVGN